MKYTNGKRILAMILTLCLVLGMMPTVLSVEAEAISGVSSLTCSSFISNNIAQKYIDTMMRYHLNNNSTLQSTLNNGNSVVFMFEGGSDNYWNGSTYADAVGDVRNQAVCIVVQLNSSGNVYIPFYCENSSSIPDDPQNCTNGVAYSGATTIKDGIYSFYTWNHTGPYGAFQINLGQGYYTPSANLNGYTAGASGLNIHTRSTNTCGGAAAGWDWSLGCQVIGSGYYTGNEFNQFMKVVAGIDYNVWLDYYNKSFNTIYPTEVTKGYYVVDRQLGKMDINGDDYGSGSLIQLYNTTALTNITASSTTARNNAGFSLDYKDQCERYASYCTLNVTAEDTQVRGAPCSEGTDAASTLIETLQPGKQVTAVGIYKNLYGNYWYEVLTSSGGLGYIYAGNVEYVEDHISDITLTGASTPDSHVQGSTFYVDGTIASKYNELTSVSCYIYNGFGEKGDAVTGTSDTPSSNSYVLKGSAVDDATWMGALELGNYTYTISASYANYYATDPTTLQSNTGTLVLKDEFFVVVSAAVDTATCSHTNTTYVLEESTCLQDGSSVTSCSTCGLVTKNVTTGGHAYGDWSTTKEPTCTETGVSSRTCSRCGGVENTDIPANGHDYSCVTHPATCLEYERYEYTCGTCGHNYSVYADELMTQWSEEKPEGVDESLMETKTQYRYSDYETITSSSAAVDGYTQIGKEWVKSGSGYTHYVSEWPSGFETSHSLYSQYNNDPNSIASETETAKTVVDSTGTLVGHVFYHWCYGTYTEGPINRTTSMTNDGTHTTFHAFVANIDTVDPSTLTTASDTSVTYPHAAACTDSHWWYTIPVYEATHTSYQAEFTHERWTDWSDWSDEAAVASDTRKVETRTLYRYVDAELGDHAWTDGACTVCGTTCQHSYADGFCSVCGEAEPIKDYYLFGYINGTNYACEEDYQNMGEYLFVDGQLVVTFTADSYVGVKTAGNGKWYMTDGYLGSGVTSATLYDTNTLDSPDKLFVPKDHELTFTLTVNEDGTLTLSYVISRCAHQYTDGVCGFCGDVCAHGSWADGSCAVCGAACQHEYFNNVCSVCRYQKPVKDMYLFGFINGADYACEADAANVGEYKFVDGKLSAVFQSDSYVAVKTADNSDWYMASTYHGEDVTGATLFNTSTGANEKLYVPGGMQITFTLTDNGNDSYTLSYVAEALPDTGPELTLSYPSLSFEDEIEYNVYYTITDLTDVTEMGLITFETKLTDGTVDEASAIVSGYVSNGELYMVHTDGISGEKMGDTVYFRVYAKLSDGTYRYSSMAGYNAVAYARSVLGDSTKSDQHALVVAMLNYGTEAQKAFGYKTDALANASLTQEQLALVQAYDESMVAALPAADGNKTANFVNNGGFSSCYPSVSFESAFSINFYFTPKYEVDGEMTLYYWGPNRYASVSELTLDNASGSTTMTKTGSGSYWGDLIGIAAKQIDQVGYFVGVYESGGVTYSTGVIVYSLGRYCESIAAKEGNTMQALAAATAVYGYYAKDYFSKL